MPVLFFFQRPLRRNHTPTISDASEAAGAAAPTPARPSEVLDTKYATGTRRSIAESMLLTSENIECPAPSIRPFMQNTNGTIR